MYPEQQYLPKAPQVIGVGVGVAAFVGVFDTKVLEQHMVLAGHEPVAGGYPNS